MNRSSVPKSEALRSRTVRKDGGICSRICCIESSNDLGPLRYDFCLVVWVGVDGRLTGAFFFHCASWLVQGREEEIVCWICLTAVTTIIHYSFALRLRREHFASRKIFDTHILLTLEILLPAYHALPPRAE